MAEYYEFSDVDAFTAGAIGRPGQRVFLLHARAGEQRVTVKCEKQQVLALGQYLKQAMSDLPEPHDRPLPAALELVGDVSPAFVAGAMALGYDRDLDRFVFTIDEFVRPPDDDDDELDTPVEPAFVADADTSRLRVYLTRGQIVAFVERTEQLAAGGRPNCLFCGHPVDPDGHPCPRMN